MIQFRNLDLWPGHTSNKGMKQELIHECEQRRKAYKYIKLSNVSSRLEYELQQMWEEELLQDQGIY
jgi:hypothetical protein